MGASSAGEPGTSASIRAFGANAWLVDDMYEQFLADPASVSESWQEFFADYRPGERGASGHGGGVTTGQDSSKRELAATALKGAAARVALNMEASLGVPTATSVRSVPAKLLEVNREILNNHLARVAGRKVSYTHLIGWAVVQAVRAVPAMNRHFVADADGAGNPGVVLPEHVGLGLAVDVPRPDGTRTLVVPCLAGAEGLDFRRFVGAYEELVRKVRTNRVSPDDFAGTTVTLTNPGTLGTVHSVPRLMPGQGLIVGVGAIGFPAEYEAADRGWLAEMGVSQVVTLTSTYDHRVIQGAESGVFLGRVHDLLLGADGFYHEIFGTMEVPYEPVRWLPDVNPASEHERSRALKQVHVQTLINMYRVRGHLIADLDPLASLPPRMHPELDPATYGLTLWDLDRRFLTDGLGGHDEEKLGDILHILRDAYCRTVGIEYMHISEPAQKRWIQDHVEGVPEALSPAEQRHILGRLNAAEAFERFLQTKYVGQTRFGLEGAEAAIPLLDTVLDCAAADGGSEVVIGMAHRGRLNVLANIVGKSYGEIFNEFEGHIDPHSVQGSGDVKYHRGAVGKFVGPSGVGIPVTLASNPSHLEAVDPVVEGMVRAKQDLLADPQRDSVLAVLVHGDAAFSGQGVVAETLNLSGLRGYRTGGTVHLVIDNQLGFTTLPQEGRTSVYSTDVAKMVQAPIFHVNGDDPEACVRVARLAYGYRKAFHHDVVIDMVCYRRYGHNEADEPSFTQPQMYERIERHRSVRKLYTERLVSRGDITLAEAERALEDFSARLGEALDATRSSAPPDPVSVPARRVAVAVPAPPTGVALGVLEGLSAALHRVPPGFMVHPKLSGLLAARAAMFAGGEVDWSLAEALALGSLLLEGVDVRLAGQDTRRGTFSQRHAAWVDYRTGQEHLPLGCLGDSGLGGSEVGGSGLGSGGPGLGSGREGSAGLGGRGPGRFRIFDSALSEFAALGFEYGYSMVRPGALVAWEAQFGDFANEAQVVIDQFIASAADKWDQACGLVLLLPHGYEGQGPDHSSARIERFLTLAAGDNLRVANATTAGQLFHLLRAQVHRGGAPVPLVAFTPKSLLRARVARSSVSELVEGSFREVLDDPSQSDPPDVRRVLLCSGKVGYDAMARRDQLCTAGPARSAGSAGSAAGSARSAGSAGAAGSARSAGSAGSAGSADAAGAARSVGSGGGIAASTVVIRVEQLHPWPSAQLEVVLERYGSVEEVLWLQEEPENMGAWTFVQPHLRCLLGRAQTLGHVARAPSGSPATGSSGVHRLEAEDLMDRAFSEMDP